MRDINAYLEAFKQKKERQKERDREIKKKARLEEYKTIEKRLKEEKKEKVDKLINEHQQWLQTTLKKPQEPIKHIPIINIGDFDEDNLYLTREELQQWENKHYPCINWKYWEYLLEKVRKEMTILS